MPKKGKGKGKKKKDINWADEKYFDKGRSILYIEHTTECPVFKVRADRYFNFLKAEIPDRMWALVANANGRMVPREGAFEIHLSQNAKTSKHEIWSGIERGPPRREKFPEFEETLPDVMKVLTKFYPEEEVKVELDEDDEDMEAYYQDYDYQDYENEEEVEPAPEEGQEEAT